MKVCKTCGESKDENLFYSSPHGVGKRRAHCIPCYTQKYRKAPTEESRARGREYQRKLRKENPEKVWANYLRSYGVTPEWYWEQLAKQGGGCAICHTPECDTGSRFSVDHDHDCCSKMPLCGSCVRGLLCRSCNVGLGNLRDSIDTLLSAVLYLEEYGVWMTCKSCGYLVRTTQKWLNLGTPTCQCGTEMEES